MSSTVDLHDAVEQTGVDHPGDEHPVDGTPVATLERLPVDRGVAAVVHGEAVAVFRLADGRIFAVDHVDPLSGVPILARGLVGSVGDRTVVASPLHKERFDLDTGECLDAPGHAVRTWPVRVVEGVVVVGPRPLPPRPA